MLYHFCYDLRKPDPRHAEQLLTYPTAYKSASLCITCSELTPARVPAGILIPLSQPCAYRLCEKKGGNQHDASAAKRLAAIFVLNRL